LEIEQGPPLFDEIPPSEDDEESSTKIHVTELLLEYDWDGTQWQCFAAQLKGPFPAGHRLGPNAFRTRKLLPWLSDTPAWVLSLAELHRPPPVANG